MGGPEDNGEAWRGRLLSRRQSIVISKSSLIRTGHFEGGKTYPVIIEPAVDGVDLTQWAESNRGFLEETLLKHGAILFRGFGRHSAASFERFIMAVSEKPLEYQERSSPRTRVSGHIYTSTDYPNDQTIFLHNENSYQKSWPLKIFFCCITPAETGGETPIADCRKVLQRISAATRKKFEEKRVLYVRNLGGGVGLRWETVFQTEDRREVEQYCRSVGIEYEWKNDGGLRIRQIRAAIATHPKTFEESWFNHAAFFHISTLETAIRDLLSASMSEEDLPSNAYYGDGSPLEATVLTELRDAYFQEAACFRWKEGDLLMLDNMLMAHGRRPFTGARSILVGMSEPYSREK